MHVPEPRQNGLPASVHKIRVFWNLYVDSRPGGEDAPVANHDHRICDWSGTGTINERGADNGERRGVTARNSFGNFRQRAHAVGSGASHEIAKRALVAVANRFEVIELGIR